MRVFLATLFRPGGTDLAEGNVLLGGILLVRVRERVRAARVASRVFFFSRRQQRQSEPAPSLFLTTYTYPPSIAATHSLTDVSQSDASADTIFYISRLLKKTDGTTPVYACVTPSRRRAAALRLCSYDIGIRVFPLSLFLSRASFSVPSFFARAVNGTLACFTPIIHAKRSVRAPPRNSLSSAVEDDAAAAVAAGSLRKTNFRAPALAGTKLP